MNEVTSRIFEVYLHLFRRRQFLWRAERGIALLPLSEAELRECIDDVTNDLRMQLAMNGAVLTGEEHNFLKDALTKKVMGPTKEMWTKRSTTPE